MPFKELSIENEIKERCSESEKFRIAWESQKAWHRLVDDVVKIREGKSMTQESLADLIGCNPRVIQEIENKEYIPSLVLFCRIIDALGYQLKIISVDKLE